MVQAGQATANHGWQWLHGQGMVCHGQVIKSKEPRSLAVVTKNGHHALPAMVQPWFNLALLW